MALPADEPWVSMSRDSMASRKFSKVSVLVEASGAQNSPTSRDEMTVVRPPMWSSWGWVATT